MKKLFFAALVATVAVGGALSVNAAGFLSNGTPVACSVSQPIDCQSQTGLAGTLDVYDKNPSDPTAQVIGRIQELSYDLND